VDLKNFEDKINPIFIDPMQKRVSFILSELGAQTEKYSNLQFSIAALNEFKTGKYWIWVAITGCYPTKAAFAKFDSDVVTQNIFVACENLIKSRDSDPMLGTLMRHVELAPAPTNFLVDATHTYSAFYVTGIQRVVREIIATTNSDEVTTFRFFDNYGVMAPFSPEQDHLIFENRSQEVSEGTKLFNLMMSISHGLEANKAGRILKKFLVPMLRKIKKRLIFKSIEKTIAAKPGEPFINYCILNRKLTLIEFPPSAAVVSQYECILENNISWLQIVCHDFVPIFHAWTVESNNRSHYLKYLRLILLADKVIAISEMVASQARLMIQAFSLERKEWSGRSRKIVCLPLSSGLKFSKTEDIEKDPSLFLMLGSIEPRKNHAQFLDALQILHARNIYVKARLIGAMGWDNDQILEKIELLKDLGVDIERMKADDNVLKRTITSAQALIQVSEAEGFGLPVAEALAGGTRVIISDIRPLIDSIRPGMDVVPLNDSQSLANLMEEILLNPANTSQEKFDGTSWSDWKSELFGEK